jgi:Domain of Unknown Function (DUF1206)
MANTNSHAAAQKSGAQKAADKAEQVVHNKWMNGLTRFGYFARGVLFAIIGFLALQVAGGKPGGNLTDQNGALVTVAAQPFGKLLLIVMVIGLIGFSLWGFVRAIFDPLARGSDTKGIIARLGYVISGVSYGALVYPFLQLVLGAGSAPAKTQTQTTQDVTAQILAQPFGAVLIAVVGVLVIVWSAAQLYTAYTGKFVKDFKTSEMTAADKKWTLSAGKIGIGARGVVFALIGFFLIQAALHVDPKQAVGLDGALWKLTQQPEGPVLLGAVAIGLMVFGVYSMLSARWVAVD